MAEVYGILASSDAAWRGSPALPPELLGIVDLCPFSKCLEPDFDASRSQMKAVPRLLFVHMEAERYAAGDLPLVGCQ